MITSNNYPNELSSESEDLIPFWLIIQVQEDQFKCGFHKQFCFDYDLLVQKLQQILINIIYRVNTRILINRLAETLYCSE
jgi:hypothetical protein